MIKNIKARLFAEPFNIYTKMVTEEKFNGDYYIYQNTIYYGNKFGVFIKSALNDIYAIEHKGNGIYKFVSKCSY